VAQEAFGTPSLRTLVRTLTDQVYWLLGPFTISSVAIGGIIIPKINLILSLICRQYLADKSLFNAAAGLGEPGPQCRTPEVQARVAHFTMWSGLISGVLSALTAPRLCALSDRWGRRRVMMICNAGSLFGEVMTIFAANFPDRFPVSWILVGSFIDGMCGSMIASGAVVQSYATDCTPPRRRNIIFGQFHGCIFTGIAVGPLVAAAIIKWTGDIIVMFYIALGCHLFFITLLVFFIPESLTKKRQLLAREKHRQALEARGQRCGSSRSCDIPQRYGCDTALLEVIACTVRSAVIRTAGLSTAGLPTTAPRSAGAGPALNADGGLPRRSRSS
jgi:MFS family permease